MSLELIVVIVIWNGLLFAGLVAVIRWRRQLPDWVTNLDGWRPTASERVRYSDARWAAFLAQHPELLRLEDSVAQRPPHD